ncbi:cobalamin biosynthesis protein CobW [Lachnospiraceae bacterium]|nr:CobW family GTP-binding protein [uncultured Schaedlerella sp.]MCI9154297.1 GTP-binding protein [Ruminococcus sp.]NBI57590.1 cobalamin biosynthesis protein CobW [Lachnospiraceae bacterium]
MTKIDIISGFLGAGKTTFIKKMLQEAFSGEQVVLIENEFGEIGIDGGFLKDSGIEIREMNSGCICCSLVGDFGKSLKEVVDTYHPERILIEPSGVGKLSDVIKAVQDVAEQIDAKLNSFTTMVDVTKCRIYSKNFGEFFSNQIEYAGAVILSRTDRAKQEKIEESVKILRGINEKSPIITTPIAELSGEKLLEIMEGSRSLEEELLSELSCPECGKVHEHGEECGCGHHHHHHHEEDYEGHGCHAHGHCHEGAHTGHTHEHHHEEAHTGHVHEHHHDEFHEGHDHHSHTHEHHHEENHAEHGRHHHHHGHHHADEIFTSWGRETVKVYTKEEISSILKALENEEIYGTILRAKGMVAGADGEWIYFDMVPEEHEVRSGSAEYTGRICVIGSKLDEVKLSELFGLQRMGI